MVLEALMASTADFPHELVVVDNGSSDPTREYLEVLAARNRHVRVIRSDAEVGAAAACHTGIEAAASGKVALLGDDVIVTPGWLGGLVERLADPAIGLVGPVANRSVEGAQIPTSYATYGEMVGFAGSRREELAGKAVRDADIDLSCVLLRRDLLDLVGSLDGGFIGRVRDAGHRVVCADEVFVHRFGEGSLADLNGDREPAGEVTDASEEERTA
jgi:GT2 family glycosyltransferase